MSPNLLNKIIIQLYFAAILLEILLFLLFFQNLRQHRMSFDHDSLGTFLEFMIFEDLSLVSDFQAQNTFCLSLVHPLFRIVSLHSRNSLLVSYFSIFHQKIQKKMSCQEESIFFQILILITETSLFNLEETVDQYQIFYALTMCVEKNQQEVYFYLFLLYLAFFSKIYTLHIANRYFQSDFALVENQRGLSQIFLTQFPFCCLSQIIILYGIIIMSQLMAQQFWIKLYMFQLRYIYNLIQQGMRQNVRDLMKKNTYQPNSAENQFDDTRGNSFKQSFLNTRTSPSKNLDPFLNDLIKPNNQNLLKSTLPPNLNQPFKSSTVNRGGFNNFGLTNGLQNFNSPSFSNPTPQFGGGQGQGMNLNPEQNIYNTNKFQRSKMECIQQLSQILKQLDQKELMLKNSYVSHNDQAFQKFITDYDNLARQITTFVYEQLQEQKKRMIEQLQNRRSGDYVQSKPILKNIEMLRNQISTLKNGLTNDQEYRRYIVSTVPRDFQFDLHKIQSSINSLRFPNVELWIDQKHFQKVKTDLDRIILARDELSSVLHKIIQQSKSQDNIRSLNNKNPFGNNPNRGGSFFDFIFK